jgi:uncharacterized protein (TIGR02246 family)
MPTHPPAWAEHAMFSRDVLEVFDALFTTLNVERNAGAAARLFADDQDIVMWGSILSERAYGRDAVRALLREVADSADRLHIAWERRDVRVERDAAWVNALLKIRVERDGRMVKTVPYQITAILVKSDGAWRWHTFNGSEPRV